MKTYALEYLKSIDHPAAALAAAAIEAGKKDPDASYDASIDLLNDRRAAIFRGIGHGRYLMFMMQAELDLGKFPENVADIIELAAIETQQIRQELVTIDRAITFLSGNHWATSSASDRSAAAERKRLERQETAQ
jgi:hypothetical protein